MVRRGYRGTLLKQKIPRLTKLSTCAIVSWPKDVKTALSGIQKKKKKKKKKKKEKEGGEAKKGFGGLGFRFESFGFRVQSLGCRDKGLGFRV